MPVTMPRGGEGGGGTGGSPGGEGLISGGGGEGEGGGGEGEGGGGEGDNAGGGGGGDNTVHVGTYEAPVLLKTGQALPIFPYASAASVAPVA